MVRVRHGAPIGHGELLTEPPYESWAARMEENAAAVADWRFEVGGMSGQSLRRLARRESVAVAGAYSTRMGIETAKVDPDPQMIVMTGHQPELYHPGVWVKDFLLQRLADETGAAAIDLVVDTDGFERVAMRTPCMRPEVGQCEALLVQAPPGGSYATAPVPGPADVLSFRDIGMRALSTLPAPALGRHFDDYCSALEAAVSSADDLGQAITGARRRFEAVTGTDYLELGVSRQAATSSFRRFAAALMLDAERFSAVYNTELAAYRARTGTRSAAQPFPDLKVDAQGIELPFWVLQGERRRVAWVDRGTPSTLYAGDTALCPVPDDIEDAMSALEIAGVMLVPKAVTLTLFQRMFVSDIFIHGTGGGRYDAVTGAVIRGYLGVEPPRYAVASMTLHLPLGGHVVTAEEVSALEQRLKRLEHNPDQLLDEVEFDDPSERVEADGLVAEKCRLVAEIASPGADKKAIGERIREVNRLLGEIMEPVTRDVREQLEALRAHRDAGEILYDRTYPYCLWNPVEVMDKVR